MARPNRPRPTTIKELLALEATAWRELTATWRGLPEAALTAPGACGPEWSVKDVMNHIAAWQGATLTVLPELLAGRRPPRGEYHIPDFNARHFPADRARSLAASRRRLARARRALLDCIVSLPEAPAVDLKGRAGIWVKYATYGHYDEHLPALRAWRKRQLPVVSDL